MPRLQIETDKLMLHPFRADDLARYDQLVADLFQILSDDETLRFIPEKRLASLTDADRWLKTAIINSHSRRNSIHFITHKRSGALIGILDIIPPVVAREHYRLPSYPFFIEFYLGANAKGRAIMTQLLPRIMAELRSQGIEQVAAVVNRRNYAASKVLSRSGFVYHAPFDPLQDFYAFKAIA